MVLTPSGLKLKKYGDTDQHYIDLVNNRPLAESIVDKKDKEVIKEFIVDTLASKDRIAIVTDQGQGYESVNV